MKSTDTIDIATRDYASIAARFDPASTDVDQTLIRADSDQGRAYRKGLLKNRRMAIIACGIDNTKAPQYMNFIESLGLDRLFIVENDDNPMCAKLDTLSGGKIVHVKCDLTSRSTIVQEVSDALFDAVTAEPIDENLNRVGNAPGSGSLSAIMTLWDDAVSLASRVQQQFGLYGDSPEVIDTCHDKLLARQKLVEKGVKGPASRKLCSLEDAKTLGAELRYPIILKPVNGAASIGIYKIETYEELVDRFQQCQDDMGAIYSDAELMGLTFDDSPTGGAKGYEDLINFVAEEFIGGKEYDCDLVIFDGELKYANINEDWDFKAGWMCERGMHHPATLEPEKYEELYLAAFDCATKIGCTRGVFHVEMKWDPVMGPQMIECNPRMGGCAVWQLHKNCWGVDLIEQAAMAYANIPSMPERLPEANGIGISHILFSDKGGVLRCDMEPYNYERIMNEFKSLKDGGIIDYISLPMYKGDTIHGWEDKVYPTHTGRFDLFYPKETYPDAVDTIRIGKAMKKHILIPLEGGDHSDVV